VYLLRLHPEFAAGHEVQLVAEIPELPAGAVMAGAKVGGATGLLVHRVFAVDAQSIAVHLDLEGITTHVETWALPWVTFAGPAEAIGKLAKVVPAWAKP
jgi:hypothetical protein